MANEFILQEIQLKTGVKLQYAEQGQPLGEVIIFLHGYTDSWFSFSRVLPLLSRDYHVYTLTQRGHGDSDKPEIVLESVYTENDFAADVKAFMDALRIESAVVVGHSLGSFIAQKVALAYPDRVKGLVLIGTGLSGNNDVILGFQQIVNKLEDPIDRDFVYEFQAGTLANPVPDQFLARAVSESLKVPAFVWKAALAGLVAIDHSTELQHIQSPTLIAWGDQDGIFTREEQEAIASLIPRATLELYPDTGHGLHWEKLQEFVDDLKAFLKSEILSSSEFQQPIKALS